MTRREAILKAQDHISRKSELAYDVAAYYGQMFYNIRHMIWFLHAVAAEINPEGFPEIKEIMS